MVTLPELPGSMETNCGEADMMKSVSPEVTVKSTLAVHETEIALTAKMPPGASPGTFTVRLQLPFSSIVPVVPSCCPALGPGANRLPRRRHRRRRNRRFQRTAPFGRPVAAHRPKQRPTRRRRVGRPVQTVVHRMERYPGRAGVLEIKTPSRLKPQ